MKDEIKKEILKELKLYTNNETISARDNDLEALATDLTSNIAKILNISGVAGSFVLYREGAIDRIYWNGEEFTPYKLNIPTYTWDKANEYSTLLNCNFTDK